MSLTTLLKVFDISAPNSFKGSALLIDRLNTFKLIPAFNKFFAIGKPIRPVPIKLTFFIFNVNPWVYLLSEIYQKIYQLN